MKKIFILVIIAGVSLSGCYDLDTYPGHTLSQSLFWETEAHVKQGLTGVYDVMHYEYVYGTKFFFDYLSEVAIGWQEAIQYMTGIYSDRSGPYIDPQARWQYVYEGIQRANHFISKVSELSFLDDNKKSAYIAEAKFLRALFYFYLLDLWGGVPYYDETTDVGVDYSKMLKPRSTAEEIRANIIKDLNEAISKLTVKWDDANYGRATKGAAYALRGKVYLYSKEWKNAIADFEEVVYNKSNNYDYALDEDYARIFKLYNGAKSKEMIFSIQNKGGTGTSYGMPFNLHMGTRGSYGSCWNTMMPSTELVDMYELPDGRPFDWEEIFPGYNTTPVANGERVTKRKEFLSVELSGGKVVGLRNADTAKILNAYKNRDPRLMATVIVPYSYYKGFVGNQATDLLFALDGDTQGNESFGTLRNAAGWITYLWRKFVTEGNLDGAISDRMHVPFEFPLIRYADVLLMLAEAYNEDGQLNKAITELNKVRARKSVNLPGLNSGAAWLEVANKEQMAARIRKERAVELAAEGHRFSDLRRWGWNIASATLSGVDGVNLYGAYLFKRGFRERDMLWPIPAIEIERNKALINNPGW